MIRWSGQAGRCARLSPRTPSPCKRSSPVPAAIRLLPARRWHVRLLDCERPNLEGTLAAAITGELKAAFTREGVSGRARRILEQAVTNGTTAIRAHPDVDPIVGLLSLDVMLELREEYSDVIDLQVVAFPQQGIIKAPGTAELL